MGRDKLLESFVLSTGAEGSHGVLAPGPLIEGEQNREFLNKWKEMHGGLPPLAYHAQAFDAAYLLIKRNQELFDRRTAKVGHVIGLQGIRDFLNGVQSYDGISGTLRCTPTGDSDTTDFVATLQIDT